MKRLFLALILCLSGVSFGQTVVFSENMGIPYGMTTIDMSIFSDPFQAFEGCVEINIWIVSNQGRAASLFFQLKSNSRYA